MLTPLIGCYCLVTTCVQICPKRFYQERKSDWIANKLRRSFFILCSSSSVAFCISEKPSSESLAVWKSATLFLFAQLCCDCEDYGVCMHCKIRVSWSDIRTAAGLGGSDGRPFTFRRSWPLCWSIVRHLGIRRTVSTTTTTCQNAATITDKCSSMNSTCWVVVMSPAWCFVLIRANASNYLQMASDPDPITSVGFLF